MAVSGAGCSGQVPAFPASAWSLLYCCQGNDSGCISAPVEIVSAPILGGNIDRSIHSHLPPEHNTEADGNQ